MEIAGPLVRGLLALWLMFGFSPSPMPVKVPSEAEVRGAVDAEPERSVNEALEPNCGRQGTPRCQ